MRTIQVDDSDSSRPWLWLAAGAALGVVATVIITDRMNGRKRSLRSLMRGGRRLAGVAAEHAGPLLETARSLKAVFSDRGRDDEDIDEDEYEDDEIDARVLEAFLNDPILAERLVEIEERRPGVIVLHGELHTEQELRHAATLARGVPGVTRVRTRLTVRERAR